MNIVLASASERRNELLRRILPDFQVIISEFDEKTILFKGDCASYVKEISYGKAMEVSKRVPEASIIIGCDTVVYYDGLVLGKPQNEEDAFFMLKTLSGNTHKVYSGITIINNVNNEYISDFCLTEVKFSKITNTQINSYIKSGEPMDKAGSYGIQGKGGVFVESINGCYYNVVGLPINKLYFMLLEMGVNL